ncbi:carbamoyltransferase HypF [Desulfohalovibrio reitneri]|uniref:carbamoyltransferase HypF n=1 Tax=Desulfohalovibrio reitneri TaxID=1307759 RepID=UPI0004A711B5|nr:carbamoyltransferase HypF [Desulfohalovibrio reitneri]
MKRTRFTVTGQVQGVGFRPFVYRRAVKRGLTGHVANTPDGVVVEVQGPSEEVEGFGRDLAERAPPLARIVSLDREEAPQVEGEESFAIHKSSAGEGHNVLISPDTAVCADCLRELFDPADRRFLYPFINCTNCGPRYTITRSIPYDRPETSMACFPLCPACREEYEDPLDRRFHAQPNACPECGPRVWLTDAGGEKLAEGGEALERLAEELNRGRIAAVKGLGGFHLAVDAADQGAVAELRRRKHRHGKPLAVMVPDLEAARALAEVNEAEAELLAGPQRPITLLRARPDAGLAPGLSPDTEYLGVMLPYTPLHHVLFHHFRALRDSPPALVMTSGNRSGDPIALGNREALSRLSDIADLFLLHDRDILIRADDSVTRVLPAGPDCPKAVETTRRTQFLRRARGWTPSPVFLPGDGPRVLGVGPELKNTLCLSKGDQAFVSQHIGDMENLETFGFHQEIQEHLRSILRVEPELLVHDLHPDYMTTRYAAEQDRWPTAGLQHHFAHAHAVLAENRFEEPALCLALDGTGFGEDGGLWGGELLYVDPASLAHRRLARLAHLPLPGGEQAIRQVWRMGQAALHALGESPEGWPWMEREAQAAGVVAQMLAKGLNCPPSSSCGRLFDAASALLGLCRKIDYEAQAAILLEEAQARAVEGAYPLPLREADEAGVRVMDSLELLAALVADVRAGVGRDAAARRFHAGLARGLADAAETMAREAGTRTVALSGGVLLNRTMAVDLPRELAARGLTPLVHRELPPGDACVSLGQVAWGRRLLALG